MSIRQIVKKDKSQFTKEEFEQFKNFCFKNRRMYEIFETIKQIEGYDRSQEILNNMKIIKFNKGQTIQRYGQNIQLQGEKSSQQYLLFSGQVVCLIPKETEKDQDEEKPFDLAAKEYVKKYQIVDTYFKMNFKLKMNYDQLDDFQYYFDQDFQFKFDPIQFKKIDQNQGFIGAFYNFQLCTNLALTDTYLGIIDQDFYNPKVQQIFQKQIRQKCEFLKNILFQDLSIETIHQLSLCMKDVTLTIGQYFYQKNDPQDGLYLIEQGQIEITEFNQDQNRQVKLVILTDGQYFGLDQNFNVNHKRNAQVKSSIAKVFLLPKQYIKLLFKRIPFFQQEFFKKLQTLEKIHQNILQNSLNKNDQIKFIFKKLNYNENQSFKADKLSKFINNIPSIEQNRQNYVQKNNIDMKSAYDHQKILNERSNKLFEYKDIRKSNSDSSILQLNNISCISARKLNKPYQLEQYQNINNSLVFLKDKNEQFIQNRLINLDISQNENQIIKKDNSCRQIESERNYIQKFFKFDFKNNKQTVILPILKKQQPILNCSLSRKVIKDQ